MADDELVAIAKTAIGAEFGLSAQQAARLRGVSAAELRDDAKAMRGELGLDDGDGEHGQQRDERGRFTGDMNQRIRQASGRR
jgi:hypothetical protein